MVVYYKFVKYFSVYCKNVYWWVATNSCFISNMTILPPYFHASSYGKCFQTVCHTMSRGRDSSVTIASCYRLDDPGIESRWGARFSAPIQTGPGANPASYTRGTGSFLGVKQLGRGIDHPPPSSAEVKERVRLYLYSPSGSSWCSRVNFPFMPHHV